MQFKRVAVDTSKAVFTIHGVDEEERPIVRRDLNRNQFQSFFSKLSPTIVVMEVGIQTLGRSASPRAWSWLAVLRGANLYPPVRGDCCRPYPVQPR